MQTTYTLNTDTVTPALRSMRIAGQSLRPLYAAGAKAVTLELKDHMEKLQARGNEMGWPSIGFFSGGRHSVSKNIGVTRLDDSGAVVTIADPRFVHRLTGGTVTPKRRKYLTIPLNADAYHLAGRGSLREIPGHNFRFFKNEEGAFLVEDRLPKIKKAAAPRSNKPGRKIYTLKTTAPEPTRMFRLVRSVTHRPKPAEAPDESALSAAAQDAMRRALAILLELSP